MWLISFSALLLSANSYSQEWNYARLALLYGGNIPFNYNTMNTYNQGVEIAEGTIFGVTLVDSNQVGADLIGFELNMRAFNGATEILGDGNSLDLDAIRVKAENYLGFDSDFSSPGYQDLQAGWVTLCTYDVVDPALFTDLSWDSHQLVVSYECGKPVSEGGNGPLLGEAPDFYRVELELELVPLFD
jgi:hypothetical protein